MVRLAPARVLRRNKTARVTPAGEDQSPAPAPSSAPVPVPASLPTTAPLLLAPPTVPDDGSKEVTLRREPGESWGLDLGFDSTGEIVKLVSLSSTAAASGELQVGDRIMSMNSVKVSASSDFGVILPSESNSVRLVIQRPPESAMQQTPPPSPPSATLAHMYGPPPPSPSADIGASLVYSTPPPSPPEEGAGEGEEGEGEEEDPEVAYQKQLATYRKIKDGWFWGDKKGTVDRKKHGPMTRVELKNQAADGAVDDETFVWAPTMESWLPYGEVFAPQPPLLKRVATKGIVEMQGFFERLVPTMRSEHTVVNLLAPPDDDEALTQPQVVQMFWCVIVGELFVTCFMYSSDDTIPADVGGRRTPAGQLNLQNNPSDEGEEEAFVSVSAFAISPVTAVTNGVVAAGICMVIASVSAYAFKWGNSQQRPPPEDGWIPLLKKTWKRMKRRWKLVRKNGMRSRLACKAGFCEADPDDEPLEEEEPPDGFMYIDSMQLSAFGWAFLVGGCFACACCNLLALVFCKVKKRILVPLDDPRAVEQMERDAAKEAIKQGTLPTPAGRGPAVGVPVAREELQDGRLPAPFPRAPAGDDNGAGIGSALALPGAAPSSPSPRTKSAKSEPETDGAPATSTLASVLMETPREEGERPGEGLVEVEVILRRTLGQAFGLGLDFDETGDIVSLVSLDAVAADSGELQVGDRIVSINRVKVSAGSDWKTILPPSALAIRLQIYRQAPAVEPPSSPPPSPPEEGKKAGGLSISRLRKQRDAASDAAAINRANKLGDRGSGDAKNMLMMRKLERLENERQMKIEIKKQKKVEAKEAFDNGLPRPKRGPKLLALAKRSGSSERPGSAPDGKIDMASIVILAQLRAKKKALRWRGKWEFRIRQALAWSFNFAIVGMGCLICIILGAMFGENQVQVMALGWLTSYAITFAIVEPFQVLVLSAGPCLFNEEHRCGRCMVRCRTIYNELCAP